MVYFSAGKSGKEGGNKNKRSISIDYDYLVINHMWVIWRLIKGQINLIFEEPEEVKIHRE